MIYFTSLFFSTLLFLINTVVISSYPDREQLQAIYGAYLKPVLHRQLTSHPVWGNPAKIHALAGSMVQVYEQTRQKFTVDDYSHYLFTPRDITVWVRSFLRYDLSDDNSSEKVLEIWAYEARRIFRDRLVGNESRNRFDTILMSVLRNDWSADVLNTLVGE
jgi:dynein heavy chain 2